MKAETPELKEEPSEIKEEPSEMKEEPSEIKEDTSIKDKKQIEIELLMRQQEQLKNLEKLGMLQQQQKVLTENTQDEAPQVRNESMDVVRSEERVPEARPTHGRLMKTFFLAYTYQFI